MGDRANVAILTEVDEPPVIFYTHWRGHELPGALESAIEKARPRWHDWPYASRIILHDLLYALADPDQETGAGISVGSICDNEYAVLVVDVPQQLVWAIHNKDAREGNWMAEPADITISFDEVKGALEALRQEVGY
jgi:hypothetical protein